MSQAWSQSASLKAVGQRRERAHVLIVTVDGYGHPVFGAANVNPCCVGFQSRQRSVTRFFIAMSAPFMNGNLGAQGVAWLHSPKRVTDEPVPSLAVSRTPQTRLNDGNKSPLGGRSRCAEISRHQRTPHADDAQVSSRLGAGRSPANCRTGTLRVSARRTARQHASTCRHFSPRGRTPLCAAVTSQSQT